MGAHAWFTLAVVVVCVGALATERVAPPMAVIAAVTVLLVGGVIDSRAALSGFSNDAPVTIAALYIVAAAAESTGSLEGVTRFILGHRRTPAARPSHREMARMLLPTSAMSALVYNTPLVATMAPRVAAWASRVARPSSWYLLPLNNAVLLGGLLTAIGTTTNVVISGLLSGSHRHPLDLFEVTPVGAAVCGAGLLVLLLCTPRMAARRRGAAEDFADDVRAFTVEMMVTDRGAPAGMSVADAGLRNLEGVYLVALERAGRTLAPVAPDEVLDTGDRLVFAGNVRRILDLQRMPGLASAESHHFSLTGPGSGRRFYEAVVAPGSPLAGASLKQVGFRARYDAAVVALHRAGARVAGKLGEAVLHPGDVLLVLAAGDWRRRWAGTGDFVLVAPLDGGTRPIDRRRGLIVDLVIIGFLVAVVTQAVSVLVASLVAALAVVALRVVTPWEARDAVDLNVLVTLGASFGLGEAVSRSGLAAEVARLLVDALHRFGDVGILAGVLLATVVITQVVTNNATAILMFPIAMATAAQAHLHERPFVMALVVGASASFLTPIGYQTNMMVYGMGGYRWSDFARQGLPLVVAVCAVALLVIPVAFPLR